MNPKKINKSETLKLITVNREINCNHLNIISPYGHVLIDIRNAVGGDEANAKYEAEYWHKVKML